MFSRYRLSYRLRIDNGRVSVDVGRPPARFVAAVREIAALHDIRRGTLECKGIGRHARLHFSNDFAERGRQAIRNVWSPPTTPGPGGGRRARG